MDYLCHIPCHQNEQSGRKGRHVCSVHLWVGPWAPLGGNRGQISSTQRQPPPSLPASGLRSHVFSSATGRCSCPLDGAHLQERAVSSVHSSVHRQHTHWYLSPDVLSGVHQRVALLIVFPASLLIENVGHIPDSPPGPACSLKLEYQHFCRGPHFSPKKTQVARCSRNGVGNWCRLFRVISGQC